MQRGRESDESDIGARPCDEAHAKRREIWTKRGWRLLTIAESEARAGRDFAHGALDPRGRIPHCHHHLETDEVARHGAGCRRSDCADELLAKGRDGPAQVAIIWRNQARRDGTGDGVWSRASRRRALLKRRSRSMLRGLGEREGPAGAGGLGRGPPGCCSGCGLVPSDPKEAKGRYNKIMLVPVGVKNGIRRMKAGLEGHDVAVDGRGC
jgi:hypothetical protein